MDRYYAFPQRAGDRPLHFTSCSIVNVDAERIIGRPVEVRKLGGLRDWGVYDPSTGEQLGTLYYADGRG